MIDLCACLVCPYVTKRGYDAVNVLKAENAILFLLPAKAERSKHPRPLQSARYAPWYLYNPSFNFFVHAPALPRNVIQWCDLDVGGLAGSAFG